MDQRAAVTDLLPKLKAGDQRARAEVYRIAYAELRRIARQTLKRAGGALSMHPSTLVHEAYLKLGGGEGLSFNDSRHFYSVLARAMRQILVDEFRARAAVRHGGDLARATLTEGLPEGGADVGELLAIDDALRKLEALDPEMAELVEWHFFAGISFVDIAAARGVTERTVRRHWDTARAFLSGAL